MSDNDHFFYKKNQISLSNDASFADIFEDKKKISFDRKDEITFRNLSFFPNLSDILNHLMESNDIKVELNAIDDFCYADGFRPDPNELISETPIFPTILQIIDNISQSEFIDSELLHLTLRILSHLSLGNLRSDLIPNENFFNQIISFFEIIDSPFNSSIHISLCDFFYNYTSDSSFQYDHCKVIIETGLIEKLSSICQSTPNSEEKIFAYKISCNLAQIINDNDDIESLNFFQCLIQPLINSLTLPSEQDFAIELLSYLFYSPENCFYSQNFPANETIIKSLRHLSKDYISDAFIAINSLIQNIFEDISNCVFVQKDVIVFAVESIPKINLGDVRPLFLFFDLLTKECMFELDSYSVISSLINWAAGSQLKIRRKAIFVLAHIYDDNWESVYKPEIVRQLQEIAQVIVDNMLCLSTRKKIRVLEIFINMLQINPEFFFFMAEQTEFANCLEEIAEVEDTSEIIELIEFLNNALNSAE